VPIGSRHASHPRALAGLLILAAFGGGPLAAPAPRPSAALIRTMDLDETVAWYRDVLGFRVVSDQTRVQARSVVLERTGFLVEVSEDERGIASPQNANGVGAVEAPAVSFLVSDVDAEIDGLRGRQVEILAEPQDDLDGRFRAALIRDYGGRIVELREPVGSGDAFHAEGR
jgi:catechol 2,3-dioxygenase-like lactoylglutathione lyase family enzyme